MNDFFNLANKKIGLLIKELSEDARKMAEGTNSEEEKSKIAIILLYYKVILQGSSKFGMDVNNLVKEIADCSIGNSDIELLLDKFCGDEAVSISLGDIELDENPPIKMEVRDVINPEDIVLDENPAIDIDVQKVRNINLFSDKDIVLDENPFIDMAVADVVNSGDIELDENPHIRVDVKEVKNLGDIELDENPHIRIDVKEVKNPGDIEMDENPHIRVDVKEVKNSGDIELDENPRIKINVKEVKNLGDIEMNENPRIKMDVKKVKDIDIDSPNSKQESKSSLFGGLSFEVKEVSADYIFDAEEFDRQVKAEREAKRQKREAEAKN